MTSGAGKLHMLLLVDPEASLGTPRSFVSLSASGDTKIGTRW